MITYPTSNWGTRKTLKIKPQENEFKTKLKPNYYVVWLHSESSINSDYDGSELVVIWFDESPEGKRVEDIIQYGIEDIDWDNNSRDFYI